MSRVLLLTAGTRGDVQPFVALGQGLRRAGHDPVLCTHARFRDFVAGHGVPFAPMRDDLLELAETDAGRGLVEGRGNVLAALRASRRIYAGMFEDARAAAGDGVDAVVAHPKTMVGGSLAEAAGAAHVRALPVPALTPTRAFPLPLLSRRDLGPALNRLSYAPMAWATRPYALEIDAFRRALGLGPAPRTPPHLDAFRQPVLTLYPVSPAVVPRPGDWPASTRLTGAWYLDAPEPLPPDLEAFLDDGPAPVVVGFSSLVGRAVAARTRAVVAAIEAVGVRAVLVASWGGLDAAAVPERLRGRVLVVASAPFERLFPRALAVVHHGGAGTTAEALRAGVPQVVVPSGGDQPYWAARVAALGVGPKPIPGRRLRARRLAAALATVRDDARVRAAADVLGARVRAEDGVAEAVRAIEAAIGAG